MSHTPSASADGGSSRRHLLAGMGAVAAGGGLALAGASTAAAVVSDASYYSYGPIRYVDTRMDSGGRISGGQTRTLSIFSGLSSYTFACNVTVVDTRGGHGFLSLYNADLTTRPDPYVTIHWQGKGRFVSNFTMLDLGSAGAKVFCAGGSGISTHFVVDVVGYCFTGGASRVAPPGFAEWEARAQARLRREQST